MLTRKQKDAAIAVLTKAKAYIKRHGWRTGSLIDTATGSVCLLGAIHMAENRTPAEVSEMGATGVESLSRPSDLAARALLMAIGYYDVSHFPPTPLAEADPADVAYWNDDDCGSRAAAQRALTKAIHYLQK